MDCLWKRYMWSLLGWVHLYIWFCSDSSKYRRQRRKLWNLLPVGATHCANDCPAITSGIYWPEIALSFRNYNWLKMLKNVWKYRWNCWMKCKVLCVWQSGLCTEQSDKVWSQSDKTLEYQRKLSFRVANNLDCIDLHAYNIIHEVYRQWNHIKKRMRRPWQWLYSRTMVLLFINFDTE